MRPIRKILAEMRRDPKGVPFADVCAVCRHSFGKARLAGEDYRVYKTSWIDDPRLSVQNFAGMAGAEQVRRALKAIARKRKHDAQE